MQKFNHTEKDTLSAIGVDKGKVNSILQEAIEKLLVDREMPTDEEKAVLLFATYVTSRSFYSGFFNEIGVEEGEYISKDIEAALKADAELSDYGALAIFLASCSYSS